MTEPDSEAFSISDFPKIHPTFILKLKTILNQASHYYNKSHKPDLNHNHLEVENGKQTVRASISNSKSMGKNRTGSAKQSQTDHGSNGQTNH